MRRSLFLAIFIALLPDQIIAGAADGAVSLEWTPLPSLPKTPGVASAFVGSSYDVLLVAGGANFPDAPPWQNGTKIWHDRIYALIDQQWQIVAKLPSPCAYGLSFQTPRGVLCVGGSDAQHHRSNVFLMRFDAGQIEFENLPALPFPIANACGVLVGSTVYIVGGTVSPEATTASSSFLSLDLKSAQPRWNQLPDLPGPGRMLSVAATDEKSVFIFSGASLAVGDDGKPVRSYLRDSWQFDVSRNTWQRRTDLPFAVVAGPSPAPMLKSGKFIILGGDDGSRIGFKPPENHPGFAKSALIYDPGTDEWIADTVLEISRVTVPVVADSGGFILASGEVRPGVRSPEVWRLKIEELK